jgi:hypothetical protein
VQRQFYMAAGQQKRLKASKPSSVFVAVPAFAGLANRR